MATRWAVLGRRASNVSFSLSAGSSTRGCFGRPVLILPPGKHRQPRIKEAYDFCNGFLTQDTSLPYTMSGQPYSATLTAIGGTGSYTWQQLPGPCGGGVNNALPLGFTFSS